MWYVNTIGSKYKYIKAIEEVIDKEVKGTRRVIEPFAGTYTISHLMVRKGLHVISNDIGWWSYSIGRALVGDGKWFGTAVRVVSVLESVRRVPSEGYDRKLKKDKMEEIARRLRENRVRGGRLVVSRGSYDEFLRKVKRVGRGSVVYIDTPKVFRSAKESVFKNFPKLDSWLIGKEVEYELWNESNVREHHERLFKLVSAVGVRKVIVECYKKAVPKVDEIERMMRKYWKVRRAHEFKNDITLVGEEK
ncbi:DNA adenine methylase [bacterium]|nr:DNA adenine methylase [bacterium]